MVLFRDWLSIIRNSRTGQVLINAGWAYAAMPITIGLGIVQTGLLARMLGPSGLGMLALFMAVCGLVASFLRLTNAETAMVYVNRSLTNNDPDEANQMIRYCYATDLLTSLFAFAAVAFLVLVVPRLLNLEVGQEWLQVLFALTLPFQATYWTSHALLRVANHFSWTFYQSVLESILKTLLIGVAFVTSGGLPQVVLLLVGIALFDSVTLGILALIALRRIGLLRCFPRRAWWRVPRDVVRFQLWGQGRNVVKSASRYIDTIMVGYWTSAYQVGLYRGGKQVTDQLQTPAQALVASLFPEYSRLYFADKRRALRKLVLHFLTLSALGAVLAGLVLWFGAEALVLLLLGPEFLPAVDVVRILLMSAVATIAVSPLYVLPSAVGHNRPVTLTVTVAILVQIFVIFWLVPSHGAIGAAWANVAYILTWSLLLLPTIMMILRDNERVPFGPVTPDNITPHEVL